MREVQRSVIRASDWSEQQSSNDLTVVPIPGPSALITALTAAGLPTDEFFFAGFLPSRPVRDKHGFSELSSIPGTLIFYEAPHRLAATLKDAREILGEREAVVARELTKLHEEIATWTLSELASSLRNGRGASR